MNYNEVVGELKVKGCKRILVTGAHRSGTTFTGYALAGELGILFYGEENIRGGNQLLLDAFHSSHRQYVLQAPGYSERCHLFPFDAVVFVNRNTADVNESMKDLSDRLIQAQYQRTLSLLGQKASNLTLPELKLKAFKNIQSKQISNAFILEYESWKDHPNWIPYEERENFTLRQITKK